MEELLEWGDADEDGRQGAALPGLGQDARGELYVLANSTSVPFGDTGVVYKIVPGHGR